MITTTATVIPEQRRAPDEPRPEQFKHAAHLMRRLWAHDPQTAAELVEGLQQMGRVQLGRVVDNLMWTLANQPQAASRDQMRHVRLLWPRKMSKPIDLEAERRFAQMTRQQAQRLVDRLRAMPDRVGR